MFYHPMGLCEIVSDQLERKWKFHAPAAYAPQEQNVTVYPYLTGITVAIDKDTITSFQMTLDAPYEEGIKMLYEDAGGISPFNQQNRVRVCIGYPAQNLWTPWYYGLFNSGGDGIEIAPDGVKGTVSIQQCTWQDYYVTLGNTAWHPTLQEMLQGLIDAMGARALISDVAVQLMGEYDAKRTQESYAAKGKDNMEVLRDLCFKADILCIVHASTYEGEPTVIELTARYEESQYGRSEEQTTKKYIMRGGFRPELDEYPILNWGPEQGVATWLGSHPESSNAGVHAATINPRTGKVVEAEAPPAAVGNPAYGNYTLKGPPDTRQTSDGKILDKKTDGKTSVASYLSAPGLANADDAAVQEDLKAQAQMRMSQGNMAQIATLTTLGVPTQGLWKKINVLGCSPRYDGPYMVQGITHRWGVGMYESEIKVLRQGTFETDEVSKQPIEAQQLKKDA